MASSKYLNAVLRYEEQTMYHLINLIALYILYCMPVVLVIAWILEVQKTNRDIEELRRRFKVEE